MNSIQRVKKPLIFFTNIKTKLNISRDTKYIKKAWDKTIDNI